MLDGQRKQNESGNQETRAGSRFVDLLPALILALMLCSIWQIATMVFAIPKWLLPSPHEIAWTLFSGRDLIAWHALRTLEETLIGLGFAWVIGVGTAILMDRSDPIRRALYPVLVTTQTVPVIAIAPLLVIWFGYDLTPKIIVVALVCFFPIVVATYDGLGSVDADLIRLVRSMGANGWQLFWRVRWPSALPAVFSGTRIGVTYGVIGAIVGEWVGASRGIGIYMVRAADQLLTERVFASIVVAAALSIGLFMIVNAIQRIAIPWHRDGRGGDSH